MLRLAEARLKEDVGMANEPDANPDANSDAKSDLESKSKSTRWRLTRRNFAAAGAVLAAGMLTRMNRAMADRGHDHGHGHGGDGGGSGGGNGGGGGVRCFLAGTRIQTPSGEVDVASLRIGDLVMTNSGTAQPIQRIETTVFPRLAKNDWPRDVLPVRVTRGALAANTPHRDLYLSIGHGLLLDGVLIPVGDLVNAKTIAVVEPSLDRLEYFQLELPEHSIVLAEGVLCESLLGADIPYVQRLSTFQGPGSQLKSRLRSAVSPLVDVRNRVDTIRDRLEDRAYLLDAA